jgi:hypothetical protein
LGGIVAAAEYKPTEQIRKARKKQTKTKGKQKAYASRTSADMDDGLQPKAFKWSLSEGDIKVSDTCSYDAVFIVLMHIMANSLCIREFIARAKRSDTRLASLLEISELFWAGSISQV